MGPAASRSAPSVPAARPIVAAWRRLTGGGRGRDPERRTLLACSGGADSSALVMALAAGVRHPDRVFAVAHILHDLRPPAEALPDRDASRALAESLGLPFAEASIRVRDQAGNAEGAARRLRYAALAALADEHACRYVATAHHAGDQLESMLMALLRGAGPRGLAGMAESRRLAPGVRLIRPMLELTRPDAEGICRAGAHAWQEDRTNLDTSRLRAALRHKVVPLLEELRPGAARRAARSARWLADAARVVARQVSALAPQAGPDHVEWLRVDLRPQSEVVVGQALLRATAALGVDPDRIGSRKLVPVIRAIRSPGTDPKHFEWCGVKIGITARAVRMGRPK